MEQFYGHFGFNWSSSLKEIFSVLNRMKNIFSLLSALCWEVETDWHSLIMTKIYNW